MRFNEITENAKYDKEHKCLTPGAVYSTEFHGNNIVISVKLPKSKHITISKEQSEKLEVDLHYAVEKVLKVLF